MRRLESYIFYLGMYACWTPMAPGGKWPAAALVRIEPANIACYQ
jgi:hypothetical protein